jgi:hypothetical protein
MTAIVATTQERDANHCGAEVNHHRPGNHAYKGTDEDVDEVDYPSGPSKSRSEGLNGWCFMERLNWLQTRLFSFTAIAVCQEVVIDIRITAVAIHLCLTAFQCTSGIG